MEACGEAHFWARELGRLGHEVRLMPPSYVRPYAKRGKTDAAGAEAIREAATRPTMRFVPAKTEAQQAAAVEIKVRQLLVQQRTRRLPEWASWVTGLLARRPFTGLLARRPFKVAAVALANKMARVAWALLVKGGTHRTPAAG
jgi:transposase